MANSVMPVDTAQREAALDIARSFIVQAPAGSGKTELLTQRFLRLLSTVDEPEEVLAITFTKKAAGEMRDRVLMYLRSAADSAGAVPIQAHKRRTRELAAAVLRRSDERGWHLLSTPARLRIQTIDSFCLGLVQNTPLQARFGAPGTIAEDGTDRDSIFREAAYNTIKLLGSVQDTKGAIGRVLMHRDNNIGQVAELISAMLARRDQWERHVSGQKDPATLRTELEAVLCRIVCEALQRVRAGIPPRMQSELAHWMRFAADNLNGNGNPNPYAACLDLGSLPGCTVADLDKWRTIRKLLVKTDGEWREKVDKRNGFPTESKLAKRKFGELLGELASSTDDLLEGFKALDHLPEPRFRDEQWQVLEALLSVLPIAIGELRKVFQRRAAVDFIEISQGALRALEEDRTQSEGAAARIQHLLIDEFQDTSVSQWRLLASLTAAWKPGDGHTLFLVGDPMQSIYRFRQAEVGLFLQAKQTGVGGVRLEPLPLNVNFRSDQALVEWYNRLFRPIFGDRDDAAEAVVSFNAAESRPKAPRGVAPFIHRARDNKDEAEQVAALAREALAGAGDVAIIVRARTHLPLIVAALRREGLRFQAVDIDSLAQRQPVLDVLMLTRALLHPADRLAWLGVLRAPWCGLTLADLDALCGHDRFSAVWDLITANFETLSENGRERLARVRDVFSTALANRRRVPLRQWIEGVWIALGGPACVQDATDLQDVDTFFDLIEGVEQSGDIADLSDLAARVSALFSKPDVEADGRLKMLTIHKAKGLEFDTVILPGLGRKPQGDTSSLLLWQERPGSAQPELLLAPISEKGAKETDSIYSFLRDAESARRREEEKRLLYVAVTRAKHRLHLVAVPRLTKDGELCRDGSLLQYLWDGVGEQFLPRQLTIDIAAQDEDEKPRVPSQLRRLPLDWRPPETPPAVRWDFVAPEVSSPAEPLSYDWVGEKLRHIGIVVHAMLQRIAREGAPAWNERRIAESRPLFRTALAGRGLGPADLDAAVAEVERALVQTLNDGKGRWTLDAHAGAESEYALTGLLDGRVCRYKFDRTFVDQHDGTRWIIDYKTSSHQGAGMDKFLDNEQARYREQLDQYARLMRLQHPADRIRVGLYFPLLRAWREWEPS